MPCHRYATLSKGTCKPMRMAFPGSLRDVHKLSREFRVKSLFLSANETYNTDTGEGYKYEHQDAKV